MNLILALTLSSSALSYAAQCTRIEGTVSFNGEPLAAGSKLQGEGEVTTGPGSRAVLLLSGEQPGAQSELLLGSDSRLKIQPGETVKAHLLLKGNVRARLKDKLSRHKFSLRTASAVMAVRGTDFLTIFNPLLGESEIVVFEGMVRLSSAKQPKEFKDVPKEHWGGLGGRFGAHIGELIHLPQTALKAFEDSTLF